MYCIVPLNSKVKFQCLEVVLASDTLTHFNVSIFSYTLIFFIYLSFYYGPQVFFVSQTHFSFS